MCACFVAGPGLALPPASSNQLLISGAGLAAAATPNVGGKHTLHNQLQLHLGRHGVARFKHHGLAAVNSRKDAHAGTLPVIYL